MPGGVGSSARGYRATGGSPYPLFMAEGTGSRLTDVDGNTYVDYLLGLGPMILGHRPPVVTAAVAQAIHDLGTCFGLPYELEIEAAEKVVAAVPGVEQVRFTNSGSEAVGTAVRLARATTGRRVIVRFEGHYHGWQDTVYWSNHVDPSLAGPAEHPRPVAMGRGVPRARGHARSADLERPGELRRRLMDERGDEIAAVLTEPAVFNTGCILPEPGYLELLRDRDAQARRAADLRRGDHGVPLRTRRRPGVVRGDARHHHDREGARRRLPGRGDRRHGGGDAADRRRGATRTRARTTPTWCSGGGVGDDGRARRARLYERQRALGHRLADGLAALAAERGLDAYVEGLGTVFQVWFTDGPIHNWRDAARAAPTRRCSPGGRRRW